MNLSAHIEKKGKTILIIGKGQTQGLNHNLAAENQYSVNFTKPDINFCLGPHYTGSNIVLFVIATKIYQFEVKYFKIKNIPCVYKIFQDILQLMT